MGDGSVLISWVHNGETVAMSWSLSMVNLLGNMAAGRTQFKLGDLMPIRYGTGGLPEARNTGVAQFLASESDWLFWIDTDMGFHPDTIDRLLEVADPVTRPIVGALCFVNAELRTDGMGGYITKPAPTTFRWARNPNGDTGFVPVSDWTPGDVVKVDATGAACIVMHRSALEKIGRDWYSQIMSPQGRPFGEDMSFAVRCVEHDVPLHVHTGVPTTHLKPIWLTERHMGAVE